MPWLVPTLTGSGPGTVGFTFTANPTGLPRTAHLTVRGQLPAQHAQVTVIQGGTASTVDGGNKPSLSGTGRYLAFQSTEPLIPGDTNDVSDVFVRDRATDATGTMTRISVSRSGNEAHGPSLSPVISANGRFVVFESDAADSVPDDTNGVRDVFLRDRDADGNGAYDEPGGVTIEMVSRSAGGAPGRGTSTGGTLSPDGRFIAFASDAPNLVYGDTNGVRDIFLRDRLQPVALQLTRVNLTSAGLQTSAGASDRPSISADGRFVAFESDSSTLVSGDINVMRDVFVRDRTAGTTVRVSERSGRGNGGTPFPSFGAVISATGTSVTFTSIASLVADDLNGLPDIYRRDLTNETTTRLTPGAAERTRTAPAAGRRSARMACWWRSPRARRTWQPRDHRIPTPPTTCTC